MRVFPGKPLKIPVLHVVVFGEITKCALCKLKRRKCIVLFKEERICDCDCYSTIYYMSQAS